MKTFAVPYCVATYGAVSFRLSTSRSGELEDGARSSGCNESNFLRTNKGGKWCHGLHHYREAATGLEELLRASEGRMGFVPNSQLIMARRPEILRAFAQLGAAINGPSSTIDPQLRNMVSQMASRAAGCGYCMAHTAHTAERVGIAAEKENALWEFETSLLFSVATDRTGDEPGQSAATGMGELLRGWALQRVLQLHQRLGGGQAPSGACSETEGLRLGTVE